MAEATVGEIKIRTATMKSGDGTASGVFVAGYRAAALFVPTLTSAVLNFISPTGGAGNAAWRNQAGAIITAQPTAGTGAMWLDSNALSFLAGFQGVIQVSAAAAQTADRDFIWHFKG